MKWPALIAATGLLLAGCTTAQDGSQSVNRTAIGAAVGAVTGGLLGNQLDRKGKRARGTVLGAVAGAAAGGGLGFIMDKQERDLKEQLSQERAANEIEIERVRDDLLKLTLDSEVSFDYDSAAIKPAFRPSIEKLANVLAKYDRNRVTVVGHTDSTGSEAYNQQLSLRRADSVVGALAERGVPRAMLHAEGRGENEPRADNSSEAGRQLNRRVEILVQPDAATS